MPGSQRQPEINDPRRFVKTLRKSQLVATEQLDSALSAIQLDSATVTTESIAKRLIELGLLTKWQAEKLVRGKYRGFHLGKYRLLTHLGSGGMSTVYLAEHSLTQQKRAIKVLPRDKTEVRSYLKRFYREGRAVAALDHPNIVRIYDIAETEGTHYMVMEFVEGRDLYDVTIEDGPVEFDFAADCIVQAANGLEHAHSKNLVHRDVKPANLFLTDSGNVKVLDLGLALLKSEEDQNLSRQHNETTMGTADYLAPEQALDSHTVDHRADIYSLGCTLFFLLTGRPPFDTGTLAQRIAQHQSKQPPELSSLRDRCPSYLNVACQKMMSKDPNQRFQTCRELVEFLQGKAVHVTEIRHEAAAKTDFQSTPQTRKSTRRRQQIWLAASISLLALLPTSLAIYVWLSQDRTAKEAIDISNPGTADSEIVSTSAKLPAANSAGQTPAKLTIDFENSDRFPRGAKEWSLGNHAASAGVLLPKGKCRIVDVGDGTGAEFGRNCLSLESGGSIEFRPADTGVQIGAVHGFARFAKPSAAAKVEFQVKSRKRFEKWNTVHALTADAANGKFQPFRILSDSLSQVESKKLRIRIVDSSDNEFQLDNLSFQFE